MVRDWTTKCVDLVNDGPRCLDDARRPDYLAAPRLVEPPEIRGRSTVQVAGVMCKPVAKAPPVGETSRAPAVRPLELGEPTTAIHATCDRRRTVTTAHNLTVYEEVRFVTHRRRSAKLLVAFLGLSLIAAACGDDDDTAESGGTTTTGGATETTGG